MIAEKPDGSTGSSYPTTRSQFSWWRLLLGLFLSGLGLWFVTRDIDPVDIGAALRQADATYIALGIVVITATMVAKAYRWQLMFQSPRGAGSFSPFFWAISLGQIVNTAVPFLRLGEVARIYDLGQHTEQSRAQALGTLFVEKVLDLLLLGITLFLLLPSLVLPTAAVPSESVIPAFVADSGVLTTIFALIAVLALFVLAYQTEAALRLGQALLRPLPPWLNRRLLSLLSAGLEGLAALRSRRTTVALVAMSTLIAILSVLTPFVIFSAVGIPLGLAEAAALHVVLTIGSVPPSTPAKVGIFEFLVVFMLGRVFGLVSEPTMLAYAILFHLVVVLPQLFFGGLAVARRSHS